MARFRIDLRGGAFRSVFKFTAVHWRRQPGRLAIIMGAVLVSTLADVLTPLYSGRLVDAVARGAAADDIAWNAAIAAFFVLIALAGSAIVMRHIAFSGIIDLTLKMMSDIAGDAFHRVQRFSTDWHANSFAGSTVRKVTRGMWALDLLNDTILVALFPSLVMLIGSTLLLGWYWPMMGVIIARRLAHLRGADRRRCRSAMSRRRRASPTAGTRGWAARWPTRSAATRWSRVLAPRSAKTRRLAQRHRQVAASHAADLGARHHQRHHARRRRCSCCGRR